MTKALFRDDAYLATCEATVLEINERGGIDGIYGTVRELTDFDAEHAAAMEAAAGGRLNHLPAELRGQCIGADVHKPKHLMARKLSYDCRPCQQRLVKSWLCVFLTLRCC